MKGIASTAPPSSSLRCHTPQRSESRYNCSNWSSSRDRSLLQESLHKWDPYKGQSSDITSWEKDTVDWVITKINTIHLLFRKTNKTPTRVVFHRVRAILQGWPNHYKPVGSCISPALSTSPFLPWASEQPHPWGTRAKAGLTSPGRKLEASPGSFEVGLNSRGATAKILRQKEMLFLGRRYNWTTFKGICMYPFLLLPQFSAHKSPSLSDKFGAISSVFFSFPH